MILGLIWDALLSVVGVCLGLFWQAHGHPYGGAFMLVAGGYLFGMGTTSYAWRRGLRPLLRNQDDFETELGHCSDPAHDCSDGVCGARPAPREPGEGAS